MIFQPSPILATVVVFAAVATGGVASICSGAASNSVVTPASRDRVVMGGLVGEGTRVFGEVLAPVAPPHGGGAL